MLRQGLEALNWHTPAREKAEQLLQQGLAIKCPSFPCPREWLDQRALFEQAIAADPTFARPYAEATLTYTQFVSSGVSVDSKEDLRIAAGLATRAVALAPDQAFAHNARAQVLRQDPNRLEEALTAYLRVLAIDPNQTIARANAGFVLLLLGRPAEAERYVQAALDAEPQHIGVPAWLNRMGLAELFLDHYKNSVEYFRLAIARQSQSDALSDVGLERSINLVSALALDGDIAAAQVIIERLHSQYPSLSTRNIFSCNCSNDPRFKSGMEKLRKGAALAGLTNTD